MLRIPPVRILDANFSVWYDTQITDSPGITAKMEKPTLAGTGRHSFSLRNILIYETTIWIRTVFRGEYFFLDQGVCCSHLLYDKINGIYPVCHCFSAKARQGFDKKLPGYFKPSFSGLFYMPRTLNIRGFFIFNSQLKSCNIFDCFLHINLKHEL